MEEVVRENGRELALLTAKDMLNCWKNANSEEHRKMSYNCNYFPTSNYDSISMKMEQTLSEVASLDSQPVQHMDAISNNLSFNITNGITNGNNNSAANKPLWSLQMHIWLLIVELFLKLGQVCIQFIYNSNLNL